MGFIADQVDNFKTGAKLADRFMRWAATSAIRRLSVLSLIGVIAIGAYYWYSHSLLTESRTSNVDLQKEAELVRQANLYQAALDWINLCISTRKDNLENADWYCKQALDIYKVRSESTPPPLRENIINREAYGAMAVDISAQLRGISVERLYKEQSSEAQEMLERLTSTTGKWFTYIGIVFLMSVISMSLIWYAGRNGANSHAGASPKSSDA